MTHGEHFQDLYETGKLNGLLQEEKDMTETVHGITYTKPTVVLLQETGLGTSEYAARTCYNSFDASENGEVSAFNQVPDEVKQDSRALIQEINNIEHSELLNDLAWTYFHHSILEHVNITYLIKGVSRGVLQEHARHRLQAISVQSTRYTMSSVINAFIASLKVSNHTASQDWFINTVKQLDLFVTSDQGYNEYELLTIYGKLANQMIKLGRSDFTKIAIAKSSLPLLEASPNADILFKALEAGKKKRNVGDAFKHIVTDNWKCDMVVTMNLRALKNYLTLRDSGAAFFQIRWLAQAIKQATPRKYLDLIVKDK